VPSRRRANAVNSITPSRRRADNTRGKCLTARQELSRQRVGLASPNKSDTHDSKRARPGEHTSAGLCIGAAGAAGTASAEDLQATHPSRLHRWRTGAGGVTGYTVAAPVEDWRHRAASPVEDREPADIEGARSRSHGPAAERPELGLGKPESTHHWTGTTCRAAPLACSDWSEERVVGRSRLDRVECGR
jgi:hypothetical protein